MSSNVWVPCRIWDLGTGECTHVLRGHSGRVNTVTVSDDGGTVVTASDDSTARVWDAATGECRTVLQVRALAAVCRAYILGPRGISLQRSNCCRARFWNPYSN